MPISHKHKTIFVHIPKTAGTSVYRLLSIPETMECLYSSNKITPCLQHLTPDDIRDKISENLWNDYYIFTITRNPFDRIVSDYRWMKDRIPLKGYNIKTFKDFVMLARRVVREKSYSENVLFDHFRPQVEFIKSSYDKMVDIYKFEELDLMVSELSSKVKCCDTLPYTNSTSKIHGSSNYRSYYDDEIRSIVEDMYNEDIKVLNYAY